MSSEILKIIYPILMAFMGWYLRKLFIKIEEFSEVAIELPHIVKAIEHRINSIEKAAEEAITMGKKLEEKQSQIIILERNLDTAFKLIDSLRLDFNKLKEDSNENVKEIIRLQSKVKA